MSRSPSSGLPVNQEALESLPPGERKELETLLAQLAKRIEENPLNAYIPHSRQQEFHTARDPVKAFIGGNRSGKSTAGVADDLIQALDPEDVPEHLTPFKYRQPPFYCRVIVPDLGHTMEVVMDKFRKMCPEHALMGGEWGKSFDKTKRILSFRNGSRVDFMSFEQDVNKFGGVALHRVHYDEEPSGPNAEKIREESRFRLIDYNGDELFTMTPLFGLSFIYDEVWQRRFEPGFFVQKVSMDDNPHLSSEAKERILSGMSDEEIRQRKEGEFVHLAGLFYDEFADATHVVKAPSPTDIQGQDIVVGIDPGLERTGVIWTAWDNDNSGLAFAEVYERNLLIPDIAHAIKTQNERWGVTPSYVIDPSARNRATVNAEQIEAEYAREGIYCGHGQNARGPGILEVKRRLQRGSLVVSKDCRNLIWEFGRYRKDPNAPDEFAAIKQDDHLLDALRYAVMARAWHLPKQRHQRGHNFNPHYEPPWKPTPALANPPLGSMS